jgi:hypothetical protein
MTSDELADVLGIAHEDGIITMDQAMAILRLRTRPITRPPEMEEELDREVADHVRAIYWPDWPDRSPSRLRGT